MSFRDRYSDGIRPDDFGSMLKVAGWIEDIRNLGGIAFIRLRDRRGSLQVTAVKKMNKELFKEITSLSRESVVSVEGEVVENEQAKEGFEILLNGFEVLGTAETPLPLGVVDMVDADLDTRLDNRFLDLRKEEIQRIFTARSSALAGMRDALITDDFVEVTTPKIVATATEGGTELFSIKYFDRTAFLNQSPQLYKQMLMASGLDRVYEIAPAFRAESHDTTRHLNEFLSVDIEMAFSSDEDAMSVLERAVKGAISGASESGEGDAPDVKFDSITYDKALELISDSHEIPWGEDIHGEGLRALGEAMPGYYFITRWPLEIKPFYAMPDGEYSLSFDLMIGHLEIASGAQRVHDHDLLVQRLESKGLDPRGFEFYLKPFRFGMPPHAGWGLGFDRLVQAMVGADNIRECILFPRDIKRLVP